MVHLNILCEQISESTIDEKTFIELFDGIFSMFKNGEQDIELIWKCIFSLGKKIPFDRWSEYINGKLATSKKIDKIRFQHIQDVIDEQNKTLITKIAEEWVMINSRGFQKDATF